MAAVVVTPVISQRAVDHVIVRGDTDTLSTYVLLLGGAGMGRAAFGALRKYQATKLMALTGLDLRDRIYVHLQRLSFHAHDRLGVGELMSRVSGDVQALEVVLSSAPFIVQSALLAVVGTAMLFVIDAVLAAVVLVTIAATAAAALRQARPLHGASCSYQDGLGVFSQFAEQQVRGLPVIRGLGADSGQMHRGAALAAASRDAGVELAAIRARFLGTFIAVPSTALLVVLGLGSWRASAGAITPGSLFAFMQYLGALIAPVSLGAQLMGQWPQAQAAASRISGILDADPDVVEHPQATAMGRRTGERRGHVRFEQVWYGYRPNEPVLRGVDLDIEPGTAVALVGASGSGKSTLALLVPRFFDPWSGQVLLDGEPVDLVRVSDLRHSVAMVFEDSVLFSTSVRENIALGRPDATDAEIEEAARLAHADAFIRRLDLGYDTIVGEQGSNLSGGQRQRLAIARAILRDPTVLLLDDATSAVDPGTEHAIADGLREVMHGRTTIIVAHRPATIALADRVVLIDDGKVIADGTPAQLEAVPRYRAALALDPLAAT